MNFQQLRIIRETVRQNFNLTEAANVLLTSQSGVSKHIRDLEDELGFEIFGTGEEFRAIIPVSADLEDMNHAILRLIESVNRQR